MSSLEPGAEAQIVFPGSTPQGDYLRGVGMAGWGMGLYNLNTAQANQINANTFIMLNEYMWNAVKNENRENWAKRMELVRRRLEYRQKIQDRIHNHPEALDVTRGDALSAVLGDLLDPKVDDSTSRYARVELDPAAIRVIPFKLAEKGEAFSLNRLSMKKKWSVAFQDPRFKLWREAYERAVDDALELAMDGRMNQKGARRSPQGGQRPRGEGRSNALPA